MNKVKVNSRLDDYVFVFMSCAIYSTHLQIQFQAACNYLPVFIIMCQSYRL